MARPRKEGRRATGIQGKNGFIYIVISKNYVEDGVKKTKKQWITTGLADIPENIKKASEIRKKLLDKKKYVNIDSNILLSDYVDRVLDKKIREVSDTTYSAYLYRAKHIKDHFLRVKLKDINERMVEEFLDDLFEVHKVQPRTVKDIKTLFGNVLELALKDGLIVVNPVKEVALNKNLAAKYAKDKKTDDEFFSYEEAKLFLSRVKNHELYELLYLTLFFGLRREEILGLRWSAIDLHNKTLSINHTVTKGTRVTRSNTTKTLSSAREYPLTDEQVALFQQIKNKEILNRKLFGSDYIETDYIFKHADGSLYYPDYPTKAFNKIIKMIPELPQGITFHGLRKSCVSILIHQGMDVKSIQKWVGHSDIDTTLRIYAKVKDKEAKMEISDKMKDIIKIKDYNNDK